MSKQALYTIRKVLDKVFPDRDKDCKHDLESEATLRQTSSEKRVQNWWEPLVMHFWRYSTVGGAPINFELNCQKVPRLSWPSGQAVWAAQASVQGELSIRLFFNSGISKRKSQVPNSLPFKGAPSSPSWCFRGCFYPLFIKLEGITLCSKLPALHRRWVKTQNLIWM